VLLAEGAGAWLPWFGGFPVGAFAAVAVGCEAGFAALFAGAAGAGVAAVPDADDAGFCNSDVTSGCPSL
jgi:hypothetical protein